MRRQRQFRPERHVDSTVVHVFKPDVNVRPSGANENDAETLFRR
ncbi:MAG TPA: hypothetical protein VGQ46_11270 [Thermoanaerobaculia bacterium]|nr:hypothetical protein [Thermoanaerobaculia bacterium]